MRVESSTSRLSLRAAAVSPPLPLPFFPDTLSDVRNEEVAGAGATANVSTLLPSSAATGVTPDFVCPATGPASSVVLPLTALFGGIGAVWLGFLQDEGAVEEEEPALRLLLLLLLLLPLPVGAVFGGKEAWLSPVVAMEAAFSACNRVASASLSLRSASARRLT